MLRRMTGGPFDSSFALSSAGRSSGRTAAELRKISPKLPAGNLTEGRQGRPGEPPAGPGGSVPLAGQGPVGNFTRTPARRRGHSPPSRRAVRPYRAFGLPCGRRVQARLARASALNASSPQWSEAFSLREGPQAGGGTLGAFPGRRRLACLSGPQPARLPCRAIAPAPPGLLRPRRVIVGPAGQAPTICTARPSCFSVRQVIFFSQPTEGSGSKATSHPSLARHRSM